jgi:hypothetical protein
MSLPTVLHCKTKTAKNIKRKKLPQFKVTTSIGLTVQLCLTQSGKYCEAENFRLMTTVIPDTRACPEPRIPAAEWYNGMGQYTVSSGFRLTM